MVVVRKGRGASVRDRAKAHGVAGVGGDTLRWQVGLPPPFPEGSLSETPWRSLGFWAAWEDTEVERAPECLGPRHYTTHQGSSGHVSLRPDFCTGSHWDPSLGSSCKM